MSTLFVRKIGSRRKRLLTLGGDWGTWTVSDGEAVLATARFRLKPPGLEVEAGDRRLIARMKWKWDVPDQLEVADMATGEKVIEGKRTSGGRRDTG